MRAGLAALLGAAALTLLLLAPAPPAAAADPWIARVHPRAPSGWATEFVVVENPGGAAADLTGWSLADGEGEVALAGELPPGGRLLVVENATQYARWALSVPAPHVGFGEGRFKLANGGDEVVLRDAAGRPVDVVVYGDGDAWTPGWRGVPVPRPRFGEVLLRRGADTDAAADFEGLRRLRFGQSELDLPAFDGARVTLVSAPEGAHAAALDLVASAKERLLLNLYQFTHPGLAEAVLEAQDRGVNVTLLLEGGPVGWNFTRDEPDPHLEPARWVAWRAANRQTWVASEIRQRGGTVLTVGNERYRFDHAKYAIADGARVLVTTENWGLTGLPVDPSYGNRGFAAVVEHPGLAAALSDLFASDADPRRPDVRPHRLEPHPAYRSGWRAPSGPYEPWVRPFTTPTPGTRGAGSDGDGGGGGVRVRPVVSPDMSADVVDLLASADRRVLLWALDLDLVWGRAADGAVRAPLLDALARAAGRGADVRVLVNDNPTYDPAQVDRAAAELAPHGIEVAGLPAGAPFVNLHAKAAVVDDAAYLGSMNFNHGAFTWNREVGLVVEDPAAADWMAVVFAGDWELARQTSADAGPTGLAGGGLDLLLLALLAAVAAGAALVLLSRELGERGGD